MIGYYVYSVHRNLSTLTTVSHSLSRRQCAEISTHEICQSHDGGFELFYHFPDIDAVIAFFKRNALQGEKLLEAAETRAMIAEGRLDHNATVCEF